MSLFPILRSGVVGVAACAAAAPAFAQAPSPHARVIVFGYSISDGGAYADRAPAGAGRFTTNPHPVWVGIIAVGFELDGPRAARGRF